MKKKLSICMIVRDEEDTLDEVLASLTNIRKKINTELIIVDTGSKDKTIKIAEKYTEKIYKHKWNNNFGDMRNISLSYAKGEWILVLDGDEVVDKDESFINFLLSKESKRYNSFSVKIKNRNREKDVNYSSGSIIRGLRNSSRVKYRGRIHEQPIYKHPIYNSGLELLHYGYDSDDFNLMNYKFKRNVSLLNKDLEEDGNNIYTLFQLSQSYSMQGSNTVALIYIERAYKIFKKLEKKDRRARSYIYSIMLNLYVKEGRFKDVIEVAQEALEIVGDFIDYYYFMALAQSRLKDYKNSIKNFQKYISLLNIENPDHLFLTKLTIKFKENALISIAESYNELGENQKAFKYLEKVQSKDLEKDKLKLLLKISLESRNIKKISENFKLINKILKSEEAIELIYYIDSLLTKEGYPKEYLKFFSKVNEVYSLLSKVRLNIIYNLDSLKSEDRNKLNFLQYEELPSFYGDIFYYYIHNKIDLGPILEGISTLKLEGNIRYIFERFYSLELGVIFLDYLKEFEGDSRYFEMKRIVYKKLLTSRLLNKEEIKEVFKVYSQLLEEYLNSIYKVDKLDEKNIVRIKNWEDISSLYLIKVGKNTSKLEDIRNLRRALRFDPEIKNLVNSLIDPKEFEDDLELEKNTKSKQEFNLLKEKIKGKIIFLSDSGNRGNAILLINEYLKEFPNDLEMINLKADLYLE